MHLRKISKIFSVTLAFALILQQNTYVFAATPESSWLGLKTDVEAAAGEYNVTTALTADEGSPDGTVFITADGNVITGASLTKNTANDPLFNVDSGVSSFSVSNDLVGKVVNNGTMTYTGSNMSDGWITGNGKFIFSGSTTNSSNLTQNEVEITSSANVSNSGDIYAIITNAGTITGNGLIYLAGDSTNTGSITQRNVSTNGHDLYNTGTIITDYVFNNAANSNITGTGTLIFHDGGATTVINYGTITQHEVTNMYVDDFRNYGDITATLQNFGTISGTGNLYLNGPSSNNSTITQTLVSQAASTLNNHGTITARIDNGGTFQGTGTVNLADDSSNTGSITQYNFDTNGHDLTNGGDITTNNSFSNAGGTISGAGTLTFAAGNANNSGTITQSTLSNSANLTNTGDVTTVLTNTSAISGAWLSSIFCSRSYPNEF